MGSRDTVEATGYLIVEGRRSRYSGATLYDQGRVAALRTKKPAQLLTDQVAVKVTVRVPKAAFEPLTPEAVIEVPEELVQHRVEVVAEPQDPT